MPPQQPAENNMQRRGLVIRQVELFKLSKQPACRAADLRARKAKLEWKQQKTDAGNHRRQEQTQHQPPLFNARGADKQ